MSPCRKASLKVMNMTLFFPRYISHRVWERSTFNSKANFFASKVLILVSFRKRYSRLAYLLFILPQNIYLSRDGTEKMLKGLKTRRELAAEMKLHISIFNMGFTIFFSPTHAFMATSFTYFWVQGA